MNASVLSGSSANSDLTNECKIKSIDQKGKVQRFETKI
jgi:hypothetical protein